MKKSVLMLGLLFAMGLTACGGGGGGNSGNSSQEAKGPWTVSFDTNGGKETYEDQIVENKGTAKDPGTPTKSDEKGDYKFLGWRDGNAAWSFKNSKVTKDTKLVARWLEKYSVAYQNADGTPNGEVRYVDSGTALEAPATPEAPAGQTFYGWMNVNNGGQIWSYNSEVLNQVMSDVVLRPLFVSDVRAQTFEAELVPDFLDDSWGPGGMKGVTYSGGQAGLGLIGLEEIKDGTNKLGSSGHYDKDGKVYSGYVQFLYIKGDTLTWELESDAAAENVALFMRISAEYGKEDSNTGEYTNTFDNSEFQVLVNDEEMQYGRVTLHNIVSTLIPFQDYMVSTSVNLKAGKNVIQMKVNNKIDVTSAIHAAAPCIDAIRLYSSSNITFTNETLSNIADK